MLKPGFSAACMNINRLMAEVQPHDHSGAEQQLLAGSLLQMMTQQHGVMLAARGALPRMQQRLQQP
jgi:hypothetical protein